MIVHDYKCEKCGAISENYITSMNHIPDVSVCPDCNGKTKRIPSMRNTAPVDSAWISTVLEVVDKKSDAPHCKEFLKHPTRDNYKNWMNGEGLRPLEPGEKAAKPDKEARRVRVKKQLMEKHRERNAVTVT